MNCKSKVLEIYPSASLVKRDKTRKGVTYEYYINNQGGKISGNSKTPNGAWQSSLAIISKKNNNITNG
jgi:hypothetical protein